MKKFNKNKPILLIYPTMITEAPSVLAMVGAAFKESGYQICPIVNTFKDPKEVKDYVSKAKELDSEIAAISMLTFQVLKTYEIIQALKDIGLYVVVGGPHASDRPEEVVKYGADLVVRNEGEETIGDATK
tara:strand:+ start:165 stop:554 length:390 start_codon:yes stop_codon:yes gene_type:complete